MFCHKLHNADIRRFWSYVDRRGAEECWPWVGTKDAHGYGIYSVRHRLYKAHRAAYYFNHGEIDAKLVCCHRCDNPTCVNPAHLWLGTQRQNTQDRDAKGRTRTGRLCGENNHGTKLTPENVLWIRGNYKPNELSTRKLAAMFSVSQTKIRQVLARECWKHI
jgi:hypothetical protein